MTDLTTTNVFLGVMAFVSLLQAAAVVAAFAGAVFVYRRLLRVIDGIETRQVAPVAGRVNAILDDVKEVSGTVARAARSADETASRLARLLRWLAK